MSKLSKAANAITEEKALKLDETVKNFMGGDSYKVNPLLTMKMVTSSSIFGEAAYYRGSSLSKKYEINDLVKEDSILPESIVDASTTEDVMIKVINNALDYDFAATLEWAVELRNKYLIRLNPQIIMVLAAKHPGRIKYTEENPGSFGDIMMKVMKRADEPLTQMAYYIYQYKGKNGMPSILKRAYAKKLSYLSEFMLNKYKNAEIGMINGIRICHATSTAISKLCKGNLEMTGNDLTWETMRSAGKSWREIIETINLGHMAALRNLRGIFTEIDDRDFCVKFLEGLKVGIPTGKQLPFRYYSAWKAINDSKVYNKQLILDTLEECIDIAMCNYPKIKGKTVCLSDNSGSAWETCTSEFGTVTVGVIDNLSAVLTAACSDEGTVVKFGDTTKTFNISKRNGMLYQANLISEKRDDDVGGWTEGGIWEFFRDAINNKVYYDNIFIYSDQQAGHGGLYGTYDHQKEYRALGYDAYDSYNCCINVFKLIKEYRKQVNPQVNVFSVQTAGYDNTLLPEYAYRTNILYGWTGREAEFAATMIKLWDEADASNTK